MFNIESLLSARLFITPQLVNGRIYFISNMSGRLSLYAMGYGGSVPEPLLPPEIALQNPHLMNGDSFFVFPKLGKILLMLDQDGNEMYKPMTIPIEGGYPEPAFDTTFEDFRLFMGNCDSENNLVYLFAASLKEPNNITYRANLETGEINLLAESAYGMFPDGHSKDHQKFVLVEGYTVGDHVVFLLDKIGAELTLLYGKPINQRTEEEQVQLNSIGDVHFVDNEENIIFYTTLFDDRGGIGLMELSDTDDVKPVRIMGTAHTGSGEFTGIRHLKENNYLLSYNIDGCDWGYEAEFDENDKVFNIKYTIFGQGILSQGVIEHIDYEKDTDSFILSFSTATSPTQIYTIDGDKRDKITQHTNERILGISSDLLSAGEDASYTSFDGTQVSARLYLPTDQLSYQKPYPLVYYIHGGPQSQERPDFAWFSMPLIQFLTLSGFAVFVPNVRGSSGYGLSYTKQVDRDWGGKDRLDHVHAMTKFLPQDDRIDVKKAGVVGRSYGGFMTLTLAFRHPELWSAAVDMFGPYDLFTFLDRLPETWKPYFHMSIGHPEKDHEFLTKRSPRTYMHQLTAPMLVIQGKNDPRVVEQESRDVVEQLRNSGKKVDYLMFENEGHDVIKFENRVTCYNAITEFFREHLT